MITHTTELRTIKNDSIRPIDVIPRHDPTCSAWLLCTSAQQHRHQERGEKQASYLVAKARRTATAAWNGRCPPLTFNKHAAVIMSILARRLPAADDSTKSFCADLKKWCGAGTYLAIPFRMSPLLAVRCRAVNRRALNPAMYAASLPLTVTARVTSCGFPAKSSNTSNVSQSTNMIGQETRTRNSAKRTVNKLKRLGPSWRTAVVMMVFSR